jgi:hypothetical protein
MTPVSGSAERGTHRKDGSPVDLSWAAMASTFVREIRFA